MPLRFCITAITEVEVEHTVCFTSGHGVSSTCPFFVCSPCYAELSSTLLYCMLARHIHDAWLEGTLIGLKDILKRHRVARPLILCDMVMQDGDKTTKTGAPAETFGTGTAAQTEAGHKGAEISGERDMRLTCRFVVYLTNDLFLTLASEDWLFAFVLTCNLRLCCLSSASVIYWRSAFHPDLVLPVQPTALRRHGRRLLARLRAPVRSAMARSLQSQRKRTMI